MSVTTSEVIDVTVLGDMSLHLHPADIGREGEHNSAVFHIVQQPASLDPLACRAEVTIAGKSTYRLVEDGYFNLTNDITEVKGTGQLQLVYSDGTDVIRKTTIAVFQVTSSLNAVDPSNPDFQDGLAQLQSAAFTAVVDPPPGGDVATFFNIGGSPVAVLRFPAAVSGGDLTEARADTLYVRQNGTSVMTGDLRMISSQGIDAPIGVIVGGRQAQLRWENALILTRGQANEPVQIENNNGTNRSDIITQLTGDARYLQRSGGQMTGALITMNGGSTTNPGLAIGENSTGFFRAGSALLLSVSGALYAQYLTAPASLMMTVPINMAASNAITNLPDAVAPQDAANRRTVESLIATAVANVPRPNSRTYIPDPVEIPTGSGAIVFLNQVFPVADNSPRTIVITLYPAYTGGTAGAFYELAYTCGLLPLVEARQAVYPTANAYMQGPIRFAATVTPVGNQIQVMLSVREISNNPARLSQAGAAADRRSYVTIEEQQN